MTEETRSKEFPLYPRLKEDAAEQAQVLVDGFKDRVRKVIDELLGELYCDVVCHIESDSWTNFRNDIMAGFRDYGNRKIQAEYNFKEIRQQIYKDFRDDIISDLDQDNIKEIDHLKNKLQLERKAYRELVESRY